MRFSGVLRSLCSGTSDLRSQEQREGLKGEAQIPSLQPKAEHPSPFPWQPRTSTSPSFPCPPSQRPRQALSVLEIAKEFKKEGKNTASQVTAIQGQRAGGRGMGRGKEKEGQREVGDGRGPSNF